MASLTQMHSFCIRMIGKTTFKPALRREASIGVTANNEQVKSYTSLNYLDDQGYLISSGFERFGIRSNLDYTITSKLKLTSGLSYTNSKQNFGETGGFSNPFQFARNIAPFYPVFLRNNDYQIVYDKMEKPFMTMGRPSQMVQRDLMQFMKIRSAIFNRINPKQPAM